MRATDRDAHTYAGTWENVGGVEIIKHDLVVEMHFLLSNITKKYYTFKPCIGGMADNNRLSHSRKTNNNKNDTLLYTNILR